MRIVSILLPSALFRCAALLLLLTACAGRSTVTSTEARPWPTTAHSRALTDAVDEADGYVIGTVAEAEAQWLYDDICGWIANALNRCDGTNAYRLTIHSAQPFPRYLWVFVPRGDTLVLPVGTHAVFIWKQKWVRQLQVCEQRRRTGLPLVCDADRLPVVESLDAVAAPADSALVAQLFAGKR
ncbi:MAG TPA: hypothetical protein VGQ48_09500 [Gemmatimonadales bacterium]|jgi:hypothetical protein|nr:hypothetical protein [Gemmatimonadales bacterium]